jgi:predicted nucleotidyltransferase
MVFDDERARELRWLAEMTSRRREELDPSLVLLFGSRARGTATRSSDLDLLVAFDTQAPPLERIGRVLHLLEHSPWPVEVLACTPGQLESIRHRMFIRRIPKPSESRGKGSGGGLGLQGEQKESTGAARMSAICPSAPIRISHTAPGSTARDARSARSSIRSASPETWLALQREDDSWQERVPGFCRTRFANAHGLWNSGPWVGVTD